MMKRILIVFVMIFNFLVAFSPGSTIIPIIVKESSTYAGSPSDWLKAIIWVESGDQGKNAYNKYEPQAKGLLCQWPILVHDVNRILGYHKYSLNDRLNDKKAIEMFWIYQNYYNPEMNLEKMARIWCGGPDGHLQSCTLSYLELVKKALYDRYL